MNSRERLLAVLRGEETDRFPWTALVSDYYFGGAADTEPVPESQREMRVVDFLRGIGADVLEFCLQCGLKRRYSRVKEVTGREGEFIDTSYHTPVGNVHRRERVVPSAHTAFAIEPLIKTPDDVRVVKYVYEDLNYEPDYQALRRHIDYIGDDGLAEAVVSASPLQEMLEHLVGIEKGIYALQDHREVIEDLMRTMHEKNKQAYEILAQSPAEIVISCEDTSTTYLSPELFNRYVVPALNDYGNILHRRNKIFGVHMCGHVRALLPFIKGLDIDGLDSIGPPPLGDTELKDAFDVLGESFFIIGGLNPAVIQHESPDAVRRHVESLLSSVGPRARLVVEVVDDLPPDTPPENLRAISEAIEDHASGDR